MQVFIKRLGSSVAPQLGGPLGVMRVSKHRKTLLEQTLGTVQRYSLLLDIVFSIIHNSFPLLLIVLCLSV